MVLSNINAGLLFLSATSLEVYGVILAGWASNSKYAFLAAMRASAQMVSYELRLVALVVVLMVSGSLNNRNSFCATRRFFCEYGSELVFWNYSFSDFNCLFYFWCCGD